MKDGQVVGFNFSLNILMVKPAAIKAAGFFYG
jgi:hypothetical protein